MITAFAKNAFTCAASALVIAASLFYAGTASASERWVDIGNAGSSEIVGVYISSIYDREGDWGPDLLGSFYLEVGDYVTVDPSEPRGCRYDILVEFADGSETIAWDENLCDITDIVVNEYGYVA